MRIMRVKSQIPNAFTLARLAFTAALIVVLLRPTVPFFVAMGLFILIYATDMVDGRIARRMRTASRLGSVLDIVADLFYVLAITATLVFRAVVPVVVLICMLLNAMVYIVTARIIARACIDSDTTAGYSSRTPLTIDPVGKAIALFYFALPPLYLIMGFAVFDERPPQVLTALCVILTAVAIARRLWLVIVDRSESD